jgi:HD-like signal output (HDOD) protein
MRERKERMQPQAHAADVRQRILLLKEIPPMPLFARKILCLPPHADIEELAELVHKSPEISARLLGMANAAYFGWPGGVRTIYDAIYKVLGDRLVKSLVIGMSLSGVFDVRKCSGFRPERYWFTAIVTAQISQSLLRHCRSAVRVGIESIHMNGLLHNLGMAVLAHLFPAELSRALSPPSPQEEQCSTADGIRAALGIDYTAAGAWLARKWHLPRDIVSVMEHHRDPDYRGDFWPIAHLVGYCGQLAGQLFTEGEIIRDPCAESLLGMDDEAMERVHRRLDTQLEDLYSMASLMATGE